MEKKIKTFPSLTEKNAKVLAQNTIALAHDLGYKLKKKKTRSTARSHR